MKIREQSIIKVEFTNGCHAWYRVSKGRNVNSLADYFRRNREFGYMKIFNYDRKNKIVGRKVGYIDNKTIEY